MRPIERVNLLLWAGGDGDGFFASLVAAIIHFFRQLLHSISSFFMGAMASLKAPILHLFNLLVDQFSWIPRLWGDIAASLVSKLEDTLPPEHPSRATLLVLVQLAMAVVLISGLVLLPYFVGACVALLVCLVRALVECVVAPVKLIWVLIVGISKYARGAWEMVMACCWRSVPQLKMMKAPGRPGVLIPRPRFEDDTRAYFTGLRASRGLGT